MGIISRNDLFAGMTNSGVLGLAVLNPISKALGDSGIMERLVAVMLGSPRSFGVALFRMMMPVALFSAFLSNTATVAILIPIVVNWSIRLEVHPGQLLMPLSFAAQLGGSMTLLGSSHCLVAQGAVPSDAYDMQFFDLAPIGAMLTILTSVAIWLVIKSTTLLRSSMESKTTANAEPIDVYQWNLVVEPGGGLVGKTVDEVGLERLPGVTSVKHTDGDARPMQEHDALVAVCNERGIVQLRQISGILPKNHAELKALGRGRRHRFLYEVGIRADSAYFQNGFPSPEDLRHTFVAAFIAGPKVPFEAEFEQGAAMANTPITGNCVILLEADERAVSDKIAWTREFALIHKVHFSTPPRQGLPVDKWRSFLTFGGFLVLIGLVTAKVVKLDYAGGVLCLFYIFILAMSVKGFMSSFNPSILGTIVGALAMGNALERTGVTNFLSNKMIDIADPFGTPGLYVMIYVVSWLMGLVINNSAIVAILAPMLVSIAEKDSSLEIKGLVWMLVYAAGTCFTTPLGYQTNLMVIPDGKYSFGDFARFGSTIQFVHFLLAVALVSIWTPILT
jgi:di/tricarboxylate transporter